MGLRERYVAMGADSLGDAELLALILGHGVSGRPALQLAYELTERFGGLRGLAQTHPREYLAICGLGMAQAIKIHAALVAGQRSFVAHGATTPITTAAEAARALMPGLAALQDEELHALFLGRRSQVLGRAVIARGTDSCVMVEPRQILREALRRGASALIIAHNHPSGDPEPSEQDREVTQTLYRAARQVGLSLVDHLVFGGTRWVSLAERGEIPKWPIEAPLRVAQR